MIYRVTAQIAALLLIALTLAGCQASSHSITRNLVEQAEIQDGPEQGLDPALWAKLTSELNRVLEESGTAKRTSAAAIGKGSRVPDLGSRRIGAETHYEWTYRNMGDYDLNGVVNINDLTPIGLHFGKSTQSPDWQQAQLADGDYNGVVNISDVTPIGQNFGGQVDGYEFQTRAPLPDAEFVTAEEFNFIPGSPTTGLYPEYVRITAPSLQGPQYRVLPFVDNGGTREYGQPSNTFDSLKANRNWPTFRGNNNRTSLAKAAGPDDIIETWEVQLEGQITVQDPVSDFNGDIYVGSGTGDIIEPGSSTGYFYSIDSDGNINWKWNLPSAVAMTAGTNRRGRVVFAGTDGMFYCLALDGKQIWRRQLPGIAFINGVLMDEAGTVFAVTHTSSGGSFTASNLYKLEPDGSVGWSRSLNTTAMTTPFLNIESDVCVVDLDGEVYSYDADGNSTYNFIMPDKPGGNFFTSTVMSVSNGMFFPDSSDNARSHLYDNSGGDGLPLGEEPITNIALNTQGHWIVGTNSPPPDKENHLNYYDSITEVWDIILGGNMMGNISVDQMDRIYVSTYFLEDGAPLNANGVQCVRSDQTVSWFYATGDTFTAAPVVVGENLLVFGLSDLFSGTDSPSSLVGIRGNL